MLLCWGVFTTVLVLARTWWELLPVVTFVGVVFGLTVAESTIRQYEAANLIRTITSSRVMAVPLDGGVLPPPGWVAITCDNCGRGAAIPEEFMTDEPEVVLCTRCMREQDSS